MKIALLGYGRMGKTIETLAEDKGHEIVYKTSNTIDLKELQKADVAIDFSVPGAAYENVTTCFQNNVPVVSGTTGWLEDYDEAVTVCQASQGSFIYASNFSIGVNLFFKLNRTLAKLMANQSEYTSSIEETHHTKKLDAPSGTAISLAQQILAETNLKDWKLTEENSEVKAGILPIEAKRIPNIPGTHKVTYASSIDTIDITHTAHSREGFALGAIIAAEWLQDKTGVFTMEDVLNAII